jgi:hypothetical protein
VAPQPRGLRSQTMPALNLDLRGEVAQRRTLRTRLSAPELAAWMLPELTPLAEVEA